MPSRIAAALALVLLGFVTPVSAAPNKPEAKPHQKHVAATAAPKPRATEAPRKATPTPRPAPQRATPAPASTSAPAPPPAAEPAAPEPAEAPPPAAPEPTEAPPPPAPPTAAPLVRRQAPAAASTPEPTVEPTYETVIVTVGPNAQSQRTPLPTRTPVPTLVRTPSPEVAAVQSSPSPNVDDVLMTSFEPMLEGGRIGLLGGGLGTVAWLVLKLLRRYRPR